MVLTNEAKNDLRDRMLNDADTIEWGTGTADESTSDTSLDNQTLTKTTSDSSVEFTAEGDGESQYTGTIGLSEQNGNTIAEVAISSTVFWLRIQHDGIEKQNDFELDYEITVIKENA